MNMHIFYEYIWKSVHCHTAQPCQVGALNPTQVCYE